jgi:hypothetical protein
MREIINYSPRVFKSADHSGVPSRISFLGEVVKDETPINVFLGQLGDNFGARCLIPNGPGQVLLSEGYGGTLEEAMVNALGERDGEAAIRVMHGSSIEAARKAA